MATSHRGHPAATAEPGHPAHQRIRYFDLLRAGALIRVFIYHATGWLWLCLLIPAIGLMFGIAGHLMAASLDRHGPAAVVRRAARLMVPFWTFSLAALTLVHGISLRDGPVSMLDWDQLIWWILPLRVPSAGELSWAWAFTIGLWYISAYLWLILISPITLWLFRRHPWACILTSVAISIGFQVGHIEHGYFVLSYLPCWLLGFASHDGQLPRLPARTFHLGALLLAVVGGSWIGISMATHPTSTLNHIPIATTLWSMAWTAVLMRPHARMELRRFRQNPVADRLLRLINARAATIYLWHIPASAVIVTVLAPMLPLGSATHLLATLIGMVMLTAVAVLAFGWVETSASRCARSCKISSRIPAEQQEPASADASAITR
ncbi:MULTISPECIES: acyltransferase [unclassified Micromonospora]|uniref:acyltransferase family protein n=1 Tax=unclassified Micromonospora TaxID=2617518 RepID=UPI0022B6A483|nr:MULTISPECIES: acyltransferase [unclassified Micromonospora]MCZ7418628.1 acyltransferase [Verrucosispora sp. WMMA2121]WBB92334.1 acyltransferase [Verrucosispora sp. WMMC514]